jgi:protein-arginine kinase activator protein McsA
MNDLNNLFNKLFGVNPFQNPEGKLNLNTNNLGEPNSVEKFTEDGIEYTKSVWETEESTITKIESYHSYEDAGLSPNDYNDGDIIYQNISDVMANWLNSCGFVVHGYDRPITNEEKIDLLETKLQYCVEIENYERAARLRDEIAELKKLKDA